MVILLIIYWHKIPYSQAQSAKNKPFVSIIIVVRNEEKNIIKLLQTIDNQTYTKENFEVIIVNDCSTDNTVSLIETYKKQSALSILILELPESNEKGRKKIAITKAITMATGSLIMATDGDCILPKLWVETFVRYYLTTNCKFISGPVTFSTNTFFDKLQIVEFASLIGTGAACIQIKAPNMCNGANLAFEKEAFWAVNGYHGYENQTSGDDEFLMHKIQQKFKTGIGFLKDKNAIVITEAQASINLFFNQRKRWASKWNQYVSIRNTLLAVFIFSVNLAVLTTMAFIFISKAPTFLVILLLVKIITEGVFIGVILAFLGQNNKIKYIPIVQVIYPFYIISTAFGTLSKSYFWKGRKY